MRLDILSSKPYLSVIPGFVAFLIKDNALNDLCGKRLGILGFNSATKKSYYLVGKYVFERHFDNEDQKNATLAALIDCHDPGELFQGNQIYTVVLSIMLNSFPLVSLSIRSTVKQKEDEINSLLTYLRCVHFGGMTFGFLSYHWIFIALHSVIY